MTLYVRHLRPASPNGQFRRWEGEATDAVDADRKASEAFPGWSVWWTGTLEDEPLHLKDIDNSTSPECTHGSSTASEYDPVTDTILWTCDECEHEWCTTPTEDDWAFEVILMPFGGGCVGCQ